MLNPASWSPVVLVWSVRLLPFGHPLWAGRPRPEFRTEYQIHGSHTGGRMGQGIVGMRAHLFRGWKFES